MRNFFNETRKAWAAAAATFGSYVQQATEGGVTGEEFLLAAIFSVVAWVVTWAVPNKARAATG